MNRWRRRTRPGAHYVARIALLAALVLLLSGCAATPSVFVVSPLYGLYVGIIVFLQVVARVIKKVFTLTWRDLYLLIRSGLSATAGATHRTWTNARRIPADPVRYLGILLRAVRNAAARTVKVTFFALFLVAVYLFFLVLFVLIEIPFWLAFWAWILVLRHIYYRLIKRAPPEPSAPFRVIRELVTPEHLRQLLSPARILERHAQDSAVSEPDEEPGDEPGGPAIVSVDETPPGDQQPRGGHEPPAQRFLLAQLPARVAESAEVSLVVRIARDAGAFPAAASAALPDVWQDSGVVPVTVIVQAPSDLAPLGPLEQVIRVLPGADPPPVRFAFRARRTGLQKVLVSAWVGGTFLAELGLEVAVEHGARYLDAPARTTSLGQMETTPGEVTLHVRFDGERYTFWLLSEQYPSEPVLAEAVTAQPGEALERMTATLRDMAVGGTRYSAGNARLWMEQAGVGLWNDMVPDLIKEQFWQLRGQITAFTIAANRDVVPWELLYPLSDRDDEGFLVEQFPVMRLVYGQRRYRDITISDPQYIVPEKSPQNADEEISLIRAALGRDGSGVPPIAELSTLLETIESGRAGMLHFCCHNTFAAAGGGSSIAMKGGPFVPLLLNKAVNRRSLAARHPLVFMNACRSAGAVPEYTHMMGWAQQFMAAGCGAFAGTLWAVRSESASTFAETFYGALADGETLGEAGRLARVGASRDSADPTWLAYTVYGHPAARAFDR